MQIDSEFLQRQAGAYDRLLRDYESHAAGCLDLRRKVARRVAHGLEPGSSVLDVGCGAGFYLTLFAELGLDAYGHDLSPQMVEAAAARSGRPIACGDFTSAHFDRTFDLVFAQAFVHLFPKSDAKGVLGRLVALARRRVYVSTSLSRRGTEGWEEKEGVQRYRSRYTREEFVELVRSAAVAASGNVSSFELTDPDGKRWLQILVDL